ncbi:MAG: RNA-binding protein [Crocinitomicaceae bacterium]|nr:RNA-binding protein [Crocinitomicaceae bacterium]
MIIEMTNIPSSITKQDIREMFERYGKVRSVIKTSHTAYIRMPAKKRANKAVEELNHTRLEGSKIELEKLNASETSPVCRTNIGMFRMF